MEKQAPPLTTEIQLMGERIVLRTSDNDPDFTAEVIELVSSRLDVAEKRLHRDRTKYQVALLALLDVAEEYVRAKRRTAEYKSEIEERSNELLKTLGKS